MLEIIPLPDARLVPKYLIDQIKEKEFETEEWYAYQIEVGDHKDNVILGLIDKDYNIKGFIWADINPLCKILQVNLVSVDKEHQKGKKLFRQIKKYLLELAKKRKLKKGVWGSERGRAYQRYGFKPSKSQIFEYEVHHGINKNKT